MKTYKVVYFQSPSESSSWNDGLFAIIKETSIEIILRKIDKQGNAKTYNDGEFVEFHVSPTNTGLIPTQLTYKQ